MNKGKLLSILATLIWLIFVISILMLELLMMDSEVWTILCIVSAVGLVAYYGWFVYHCLKNKNKVELLQQQYIETLKPDKPLRFCPTDDELMVKHFENKEKSNLDKQGDFVKHQNNTNEDSEEMEIEQ